MRPVIGIVMAEDPETPYDKIHRGFMDYIVRAGGLPVCLPPVAPELTGRLLDGLDGLLLTGGGDVDPALYGEAPTPLMDFLEPGRDLFEPPLIRDAWARQTPILAVCRGMQMLNVVLGGTLWQDLSLRGGETLPHRQQEPTDQPTHHVDLTDPALIAVFGRARLEVNTHHHQMVKEVAPALLAAGQAPDGVVEALVPGPGCGREGFCVAVQWHPERMGGPGGGPELFPAFVRAAAAYRK